MEFHINRFLKIGAPLTITAVMAGVALTALAQDDPPPPGAQAPISSSDESVADRISILNRPRTADDVLPPGATAMIRENRLQGANPDLARRAIGEDDRALYLVPAANAVCIVVVESPGPSSMSCGRREQLDSKAWGPQTSHTGCQVSAETGLPVCTGATLAGVVPDGVGSVAVLFRDGTKVEAPVTNNAYLIDIALDPEPVRLTYDIASRRVSQRVAVIGPSSVVQP